MASFLVTRTLHGGLDLMTRLGDGMRYEEEGGRQSGGFECVSHVRGGRDRRCCKSYVGYRS